MTRILIATLLLLGATLGIPAQAAPLCTTISVTNGTPSNTLPPATTGTSYSQTFTASGSAATPFGYQITSGLPAGLGLSIVPSTGVLSGTPTQAGTFFLTITGRDTNGCTGGRTYQLDIGVGDQTINFTSTAPAAATVGGPTYNVMATATSGLPVALTIDASATSVCSIAGSTVSFAAIGTCVIDANQAGNASFNPAPQVQQSFAVGIGSQNITFTSTPPASPTVGGPTYTVTATGGGSGNPVTFTIDATATSVCSIAGATVSFLTTGTCVIDADQAGNANYSPAPQAMQSFAIGKSNQTITFTSTAPASATVGGATYAPTATASSGLAVTFTVDASAASICSISGGNVSFLAAGTCVIDANQAGDSNYNAAPQVQQSFAVGKGDQTISITSTAPVAATVGGATYNVTATATSGLAVTFTIDASATSICSIAGSTVSFTAVGTCIIDANQAGNANYNAAPQVQQSFAVGQGSQAISFTSTAPVGATVNGPTYNVTATASSGLAVTLTIDASATSVCSIAGSTVSFIGTGTCVIDANQAGNANYTAAPQAQQSFGVGLGNQTITFTSTAPSGAKVGGPTYNVTATGGASGNPVVFTIDATATSICSIAGSTVSFIAVGTCVIDADQAGNANYNPALTAQQSFGVAIGDQTITYTSTAPAAATVGGATYNVTATASSGLPVTFTIDATATSVCSIAGSTVSFMAVGTCVIDANQAGDANWNPAPQAQQSFTVGQGSQTISFTSTAPAAAKVGGTTYNVTATATSGLPVTFTIDATATSVCSIAGSTVSFLTVGTCKINANQAGNANYTAAPQVQQSFAVAKGDQTITFTSTPPPGVKVNDAAYTVTATASSGLTVTFSLDASSTGCSLAGSSVTFPAGGTCVIDANQAGNANYNAATQVQQTFVVAKLDQTITFTSTAPVNAKVGGPTYTVTATASSGLTVTFSAGSTACTVAGSTVSFVHATTCTVNADQAGNAQYNAAPQVQQSFAVAKGDQTINVSTTAPTFGSASASASPHTYTITATATSGLTVTFTTSGACSNSAGLVTFGPGAGACTINADQAGNADWNAAPQVQQSTTVEIPASAVGDGHAVTGNVAIAAGTSVMSNDSGTAIAIKSYGATTGAEQTSIGSATATAQGGSVTLIAAGTYNYDPPANFTGSDTFKYIIGNDLAATSTGTVTLTVTDRIVIVATAGVGGANCKRASACTLATADALAAPTGIDLVFVQSGGYTNPNAAIALNANQKLVGNLVSLGQAITDAGITLAAESVGPTAIAANTTPTLTNNATSITLGGGNLVEYFSITNSAGSALLGNVAGSGTSTIKSITVTDGGNAGSGVTISANVGTLNFSDLIVTTSSGNAFAATGGGSTINVTTGSNPNTLTSTTGTALNVTNTTIGASGMTFKSVAVTGNGALPTNGIVLNTTGAGSLTVTGDGGGANNGSGGTIQATGGHGISITNAGGVLSLGYINVTNPGLTGIQVIPTGWTRSPASTQTTTGAGGFTLNRCNMSDNAGAVTDDDGITLANVTGTISLTNNVFTASRHQGVTIDNFNKNIASFTMTGNTVQTTPGGDGILMQMRGNSVMTTGTIGSPGLGNTIANNSATGLQIANQDTGNIASMTIQNNTVSGNNAGMDLDLSQSSSMTVTVQNNTYNNQHSTALNLVQSTSSTAGSLTATLRGNLIGTAGTKDSGSAIGSGIRIANGGVNLAFTIDSNNIQEVPNGRGIDWEPQAYTVTNNNKVQIINNTIGRPSGTNQSIGCGANVPCPLASIFVLSDNNGGAFDHVCTKITGNTAYDPTSWPAGGEAAFYFARRTTTSNTLTLEGNTAQSPSTNILGSNTVTNFTAANFFDENAPGQPTVVVASGTCGGFPP